MPIRKIKILLIIIGLFVMPFMEISNIQPALAEEFDPPTLTSGEEESPAVLDEGIIMEPVTPAENSQDTVGSELGVLTGQTPESVLPPGSVEVPLPASQQPGEGSLVASGDYQSRPEGSYILQKGIHAISGPDVLLLHADSDLPGDSPIQTLLQAYGDLGAVDLYDAQVTTPSLSLLKEYDVVVTWSNFQYHNPTVIGDVLADYVDLGGKVINAIGSIGTHGWEMGGRFITGNYTAMNGGNIVYSWSCKDGYNTASPIMFGNVSVCDYYRIGGTYLTPGSSMVSTWGDWEMFVAAKDDRSVVSINGFFGKQNFLWQGRMPDVLHNAIWWLHDTTSKGSFGWDNGPLVTHPLGGYDVADASVLDTSLGMNTYGWGNQLVNGWRVADEFEVTDPAGWDVDQITFFAYQTNSTTTSTITGVYYQIWDGPPDDVGSSVVYGSLTPNRLKETYWTNVYRVTDYDMGSTSRPVMAAVVHCGAYLAPGTYWLDWMVDGTLTSGPWAPPISIIGQTTTGNGMQYTGSWDPVIDTGTGTQQGFPFVVQGYVRYSLWNQSLSQVNRDAIIDQEFPDIPTLSAYLADDFYVHTQWKVNYIYVAGDGWNGFSTLYDADWLTFEIYEDNGGVPAGDPEGGGAPPIWVVSIPPSHPNVVIFPGSGGFDSNTLLKVPNPVTLPQGRYWLIFYPTLDFSSYGQFGRQSADTPYGHAGQFINPQNGWGFGPGWQDWRNIVGHPEQDIAFRLGGTDIFVYLPLIMK